MARRSVSAFPFRPKVMIADVIVVAELIRLHCDTI